MGTRPPFDLNKMTFFNINCFFLFSLKAAYLPASAGTYIIKIMLFQQASYLLMSMHSKVGWESVSMCNSGRDVPFPLSRYLGWPRPATPGDIHYAVHTIYMHAYFFIYYQKQEKILHIISLLVSLDVFIQNYRPTASYK